MIYNNIEWLFVRSKNNVVSDKIFVLIEDNNYKEKIFWYDKLRINIIRNLEEITNISDEEIKKLNIYIFKKDKFESMEKLLEENYYKKDLEWNLLDKYETFFKLCEN